MEAQEMSTNYQVQNLQLSPGVPSSSKQQWNFAKSFTLSFPSNRRLWAKLWDLTSSSGARRPLYWCVMNEDFDTALLDEDSTFKNARKNSFVNSHFFSKFVRLHKWLMHQTSRLGRSCNCMGRLARVRRCVVLLFFLGLVSFFYSAYYLSSVRFNMWVDIIQLINNIQIVVKMVETMQYGENFENPNVLLWSCLFGYRILIKFKHTA